ncbi:MAG: Fe-S cluster assembly protein SufD [Parvibaculaceae bacterium]|nr:Fe-S cluster assembly protein SufD [Parvibaculaceae bacterium]
MSDRALAYLKEVAVAKGGPAWLDKRRKAARASFADAGFPHRRIEAWRYTDLARLMDKTDWKPAQPETGAILPPEGRSNPFGGIESWKLIFVNGFFRADLSDLAALPEGLEITSLGQALAAGTKFESIFDATGPEAIGSLADLNAACARDGAVIRVKAGVKLEKPLELIHYTTKGDGYASHLRHIVELGQDASLSVLEAQIGWGGHYLADRFMHVNLQARSNLTHVRVEDEDTQALHLTTLLAEIEADANYKATTLALGGRAGRMQSAIRFKGEGGNAVSDTAYLLRADQHLDTTMVADHAVPACNSAAQAKGVLAGRATGVFQSKVVVAPGAQKSDARQMSNALLLSRDAAMNAKPELEIYADDVQCAHGSTIGELDGDALFYLRSRGIEEPIARQLLISAFLAEVLENVPEELGREPLRARAENWFETDAEKGGSA